MAWEKRWNQRYYYRSVRVGKKVRKIYFGRGPEAECAAVTYDLLRAERTRIADARRRNRTEFGRVVAALDDFARQLDRLETANRLVADNQMNDDELGRRPANQEEFYEMITSSQTPALAPQEAEVEPGSADRPQDTDIRTPETQAIDEHVDGRLGQSNDGANDAKARPSLAADIAFQDLVRRANGGNSKALSELREVLDKNPLIWQRVGDLAAHSRLILVRLIAGDDQLLFESVLRQAQALETQLASDSAPLLERLSAEHVVACWLQARYTDAMTANATESAAQAKFWSMHQDRAHRRYVTAIKQLAAVRQLLPTPDIGEQANAAKAATAELCEKQGEGSDGCRGDKTDSNGSEAKATGGSKNARNGHAHGRINGHESGNGNGNGNGKPRTAVDNEAKVEPTHAPGETDKPRHPDHAIGQPVNRILPFSDASAAAS